MRVEEDHAAAAVLLASGAGFLLASATWHRALGVAVRGIDLDGHEGTVYGLASLATALIAGYRVVARGPFHARAAALPAALAASAVASYLWGMHRSGGVIADTLREAGVRLPGGLASGGVAWGAWAALAAAAASLGGCLLFAARGRPAGVDAARARR